MRLVTLSTCKAAFYALTDATNKTIWIHYVVTNEGHKSWNVVSVRSDNVSAIDWATGEHPLLSQAKQIVEHLFYTRSKMQDHSVAVSFIATEKNDGGILAKPITIGTMCNAVKSPGIGLSNTEKC